MQHNPKDWCKVHQLMPPAAYNAQNAASVDVPLDTIGFRYALIIANCGAMAATWSILVTAAATSGGSYTAITGAAFDLTATDDDSRQVGTIDLHGAAANLDRFLGLGGTGASGVNNVGIVAVLFNPIDSTTYLDYSSGGADELAFEV